MRIINMLVLILVGTPVLLGAGRRLRLDVPRTSGEGMVDLRAFIAFAPGEAERRGDLVLRDAAGRLVTADFRPTANWPDGSIRCLIVRAAIPARRVRDALILDPGPLTPGRINRSRSEGISYFRKRGVHRLNTGALAVTVDPDGPELVDEVTIRGKPFFLSGQGPKLRVLLDGTTYRAVPPRRVVVRRGKAAAEVHVRGFTRDDTGRSGPEYLVILEVLAGSSDMIWRIEIRGGESSGACEGIRFEWNPARARDRPRVALGGESLGRIASGTLRIRSTREGVTLGRIDPGGEGSVFAYDPSGCGGDVGTTCVPSTHLDVAVEGACLHTRLHLPRFEALHPWGLDVSAKGRMCIDLLSRSFDWEPDIVVGRVLGIAGDRKLAGKGVTRRITTRRDSGAARWALPFESPSEEILEGLSEDSLYLRYLALLKRLLDGLADERSRWSGFRDYGDYRTPFGHHANLEFDPAAGLLVTYLITGDDRLWDEAGIMLDHWLTHDLTGTSNTDLPAGVPFVHGRDHASGWIEAGHMWTDGALLRHRIGGGEAHLETARAIGRYLAGLPRSEYERAPERWAGWGLVALCALIEAGEEEFTDAANRLAALLRDHQSGAGWFCFERIEPKENESGPGPFGTNTWVTAAGAAEGLFRHHLLSGDERSREAVVRIAGWLVRDGWDPSVGRWRQRLHYATDRDRTPIPEEHPVFVPSEKMPFLALALARAARLAPGRDFGARARTAAEAALIGIDARFPRYPGAALAVVARCLPVVVLTVPP